MSTLPLEIHSKRYAKKFLYTKIQPEDWDVVHEKEKKMTPSSEKTT